MNTNELASMLIGRLRWLFVLAITGVVFALGIISPVAYADKGPGGGSGSSGSNNDSGKDLVGVLLMVPVITSSAITPFVPVIPAISGSNSGSSGPSANLALIGTSGSNSGYGESSAIKSGLSTGGDDSSRPGLSGNIPVTDILILASQRDSSGQGSGDSSRAVVSIQGNEVLLEQGKSIELVDPASSQLRVEVTAPKNHGLKIGQIIANSTRSGIYAGLSAQAGGQRAERAVGASNGRIMLKAMRSGQELTGVKVARESKNSSQSGSSGRQGRFTVGDEAGCSIADNAASAAGLTVALREANSRGGHDGIRLGNHGRDNRNAQRLPGSKDDDDESRHGSGRDDSRSAPSGKEDTAQSAKAGSAKAAVCS